LPANRVLAHALVREDGAEWADVAPCTHSGNDAVDALDEPVAGTSSGHAAVRSILRSHEGLLELQPKAIIDATLAGRLGLGDAEARRDTSGRMGPLTTRARQRNELRGQAQRDGRSVGRGRHHPRWSTSFELVPRIGARRAIRAEKERLGIGLDGVGSTWSQGCVDHDDVAALERNS
jgi:hypothetical protein